jgi:nucleolin
MRVDFSAQLPGRDNSTVLPSTTLYVGNIGAMSNEDLRDIFRQYSVVDSRISMSFPSFLSMQHLPGSICVVPDKETGASRGFGYVEFETIEDATTAKDQLNGEIVGDVNIRIDFAPPKRNANDGGQYGGGRDGARKSKGYGGRGRGGGRGGY